MAVARSQKRLCCQAAEVDLAGWEAVKLCEIREDGSPPHDLTSSTGIWLNFKFPFCPILTRLRSKWSKGVKLWMGEFPPPFLFLAPLISPLFHPSAALCLCVSLFSYPLVLFFSLRPPAVGAALCTEVQRCSLWQPDREERCSDGGGRPRARTLWSTPVSLDTLLFGLHSHLFHCGGREGEGERGRRLVNVTLTTQMNPESRLRVQ